MNLKDAKAEMGDGVDEDLSQNQDVRNDKGK